MTRKRAGKSNASAAVQNKQPKVSGAITKRRLCHELLVDDPAYRELVESSSKLRLPQETALELLCFLHVMHHDFSNTLVGSGLSPSCKLDALWHHMLLNTRLRQAVTVLLGFEVEHSTASASDAQEAKIERQLSAMSRLERAGFWGSPCLQVWAEKGTAMESITRVEGTGPAHFLLLCFQCCCDPKRFAISSLHEYSEHGFISVLHPCHLCHLWSFIDVRHQWTKCLGQIIVTFPLLGLRGIKASIVAQLQNHMIMHYSIYAVVKKIKD
ncbi:hypothetical protein DUNSADRAFT_3486 [Dunaliella salina]|uniref:Uncharacterized protein n=1 Tax=Dunaliella salina TaxID=3046 RepID=A0ABQ7GTX2_DUNSA|nr:hypothetical protein DUNSADRAFT_3486 [Dunaliella salina]|eukprot:KAF5838052.1 hypothetical protein DUNSADRAFT_3486 [Dunaliella salina]